MDNSHAKYMKNEACFLNSKNSNLLLLAICGKNRIKGYKSDILMVQNTKIENIIKK